MKAIIKNWSPKHAEMLATLRVELLADCSPETEILREVAQASNAFPVYSDIGGCLVLSSDGKIFCYLFALQSQDESVTDDFDREWLHFAWHEGARSYPLLMKELVLSDQ